MSFPAASLQNVVAALMAGLNGAKIAGQESDANPRGHLTASDRINVDGAIPDGRIPFLKFSTGSLAASEWQDWQQQVKVTIPAILKVRVRPDEGGARCRQAIDELFKRTSLIRGLPVDESGNVVAYGPDTARRFDAGELQEMVDRTGPHFSVAKVTELPGSPYAVADVTFTVEYLFDMDPRTYHRAQAVVIGVNLPGVAGEHVETDWTPGAPTPAADDSAAGRFNTPAPEILVGTEPAPRAFPPFPPGDEQDHVEGPRLSDAVAGVTSYPPAAAVGIAGTYQLVALVRYGDGNTRAVTAAATWATSDATKATVVGGLVTGVGAGTANITATYLGTVSTVTVVTVS